MSATGLGDKSIWSNSLVYSKGCQGVLMLGDIFCPSSLFCPSIPPPNLRCPGSIIIPKHFYWLIWSRKAASLLQPPSGWQGGHSKTLFGYDPDHDQMWGCKSWQTGKVRTLLFGSALFSPQLTRVMPALLQVSSLSPHLLAHTTITNKTPAKLNSSVLGMTPKLEEAIHLLSIKKLDLRLRGAHLRGLFSGASKRVFEMSLEITTTLQQSNQLVLFNFTWGRGGFKNITSKFFETAGCLNLSYHLNFFLVLKYKQCVAEWFLYDYYNFCHNILYPFLLVDVYQKALKNLFKVGHWWPKILLELPKIKTK